MLPEVLVTSRMDLVILKSINILLFELCKSVCEAILSNFGVKIRFLGGLLDVFSPIVIKYHKMVIFENFRTYDHLN